MKIKNKLIPLLSVVGISGIVLPITTSCNGGYNKLTVETLSSTNLSGHSTSGSGTIRYKLKGGQMYHYTKLSCSASNVSYSSEISYVNLKTTASFEDIEEGIFSVYFSWTLGFSESHTSGSFNFPLSVSYSDSHNSLDTYSSQINVIIA